MIKEIAGILLGRKGQGTLRAHMVRGTVGTFVFKVINTILVFGTSLILTRLLGVKEYGVYAYAISWASLLSVPTAMGLDTLLVREVARYKTLKDWSSLRGILRWSDRIVLALSLGLAITFALVIRFNQERFEPTVRKALWTAISLIPLLAFVSLRQGAIWGLGYVVGAQVPLMLLLPVLFLTFISILYFAIGLSGISAVGMKAVAAVCAFLTGANLLKKYLPKPVQEAPPGYHSREWLRSALSLLFISTAGTINQQLSVVMVGSMLSPEAAGIFTIAQRGAGLISFILVAVNMPLAPTVASLYARGDKERLQRVITKSARIILLSALPIALGLIFFGRWVLLIFGREFTTGSTALAILSLGHLANAGMGSVGLLLNMTGYERDTAKGIGIAALVNIILNVILIPLWRIEGAAVANAVSMVTWNVLLAVWVYKRLGIYSTAFGPIQLRRCKV